MVQPSSRAEASNEKPPPRSRLGRGHGLGRDDLRGQSTGAPRRTWCCSAVASCSKVSAAASETGGLSVVARMDTHRSRSGGSRRGHSAQCQSAARGSPLRHALLTRVERRPSRASIVEKPMCSAVPTHLGSRRGRKHLRLRIASGMGPPSQLRASPAQFTIQDLTPPARNAHAPKNAARLDPTEASILVRIADVGAIGCKQ